MVELIPKFEDFSQENREAIFRFFMARTANSPLSEDLTQETFMKVWKHWPPSHTKTIRGWLFTIAANLLRDHFRHQKVAHRYQDHLQQEVSRHRGEIYEDRLSQMHVREILACLDPESREILTLREVDGMSIEEIMEHLQMTRDRVRYRLKKSREKFVRLYNQKG